jgi:hypothetical protein
MTEPSEEQRAADREALKKQLRGGFIDIQSLWFAACAYKQAEIERLRAEVREHDHALGLMGKSWKQEVTALEATNSRLREQLDAVVSLTNDWEKAYSVDIFGEVTAAEIDENASLITRNSAAMGRFMAGVLKRTISEAPTDQEEGEDV